MQMDDKEASLIRVEEQLKESAKNQVSIMADLKEIFGRLERESKISTIISGDIKGHLEASQIKWDGANKRFEDGDEQFKELSKELSAEKEARTSFEQEVKTSLKTIKWVFGTLATVATIISVILGIIEILHKLTS